jgi:hypothetical protein
VRRIERAVPGVGVAISDDTAAAILRAWSATARRAGEAMSGMPSREADTPYPVM